MNDFLKKLRTTQQKSSGNQRKNMDGHFYPHKDVRKKKVDRRSENMDELSKNLNEILPVLTENCSAFISAMDQYIEAIDDVSKTRVKVNESIASFFDNLNLLLFGENPSSLINRAQTPPSNPNATGYTIGNRYTKGEVIELIRSMRKEGTTFSVIAEYLRDKGIPTFSGRGDWHAQTIHRLCK